LISAGAVVRLLEHVHRQSYGTAFRQWLPAAGTDGTLRWRMTAPGLKGRIQAKTGSMEGVRALSGFLKTVAGETLAFAMLVNHLKGDEADLEALQEEFLQVLVDAPRTGPSTSSPQ
jgi:D-alanyl-D-alanine carboxypeptidase/D-alanyl-D-alanine-endopeptidase (penicillin-binding protein 4)